MNAKAPTYLTRHKITPALERQRLRRPTTRGPLDRRDEAEVSIDCGAVDRGGFCIHRQRQHLDAASAVPRLLNWECIARVGDDFRIQPTERKRREQERWLLGLVQGGNLNREGRRSCTSWRRGSPSVNGGLRGAAASKQLVIVDDVNVLHQNRPA